MLYQDFKAILDEAKKTARVNFKRSNGDYEVTLRETANCLMYYGINPYPLLENDSRRIIKEAIIEEL